MRRRFLAATFLFLVAGPLPCLAQMPDTTGIRSAEARRGFVLLERHKTTSDLEIASEAARAFAAAIKADRTDVWAHYGLALTLYNAKKTLPIVRAAGLGDGEAAQVTVRLLERALDIDPDFLPAAELLEPAAEQARNRKAQARAFEVLDKHGKLNLDAGGELADLTDNLRAARIGFDKHDDDAAAQAYFAGAQSWDATTAAAYVEDIAVIATPEELISLTDGSLAKRAEALELFWKKRSVRDGVSVADRMGEHYRRITYARSRYPVRSARQSGRDLFGYMKKGLAADIDDRGLVYVRYGAPTEVQNVDVGLSTAGMTWAYLEPNGTYTVFRFATNGLQPPSYRLVSNIVDMLGPMPANVDQARMIGAVLAGQAKYDPRYAFIASRLDMVRLKEFALRGLTDPRMRGEMSSYIDEDLADILQLNLRISEDNHVRMVHAFYRDAAHPRFRTPLTMFHDLATFRGNGCTDLVYTVAVAAPKYQLNVAVTDTFTWETQGVDALVSKETPSGGYLRSTGVLCTKPDYNAFVRLTAATDSLTGVTAGGDFTIPDYASRSELLMSDLLFAHERPGPFVRGHARLALVPPRQFRQNEPFRIFYELYNLPAGRRYQTDITFETVRANVFAKLFKGRSRTTVSFEDAAATGDVVQEMRTLLPEIEPGEVRVTIKVTDLVTGMTASKTETMWIVP